MNDKKIKWKGTILAVQPRINLMRSFDEKSHQYLGYTLRINGNINGTDKVFLVGIGKETELKQQFKAGDVIQGEAVFAPITQREIIDLYKVSKLEILQRGEEIQDSGPPWLGTPQDLEIYRAKGHRRLSSLTYAGKCLSCIWGCKMEVEIIIDHWNPSQKEYRFETFCYGPRSCKYYKSGPRRKVPGRNGMIWEDPN